MKQAVLIAICIICSTMPAWAELKVAHFNLQQVVSLSDAGKEARELHGRKQRSYQEEIDVRAAKLKELKESIDKQAATVRVGEPMPVSLAEKDKEYGVQARELQRLSGGYQEELKVYDAELTRKVVEEFSLVLTEHARKHSYDYILRSPEAMAFASEKLDLTDELVKEFNQRRKNK